MTISEKMTRGAFAKLTAIGLVGAVAALSDITGVEAHCVTCGGTPCQTNKTGECKDGCECVGTGNGNHGVCLRTGKMRRHCSRHRR